MFDYKLLEAFAMVVQEKGFEKAAQQIHITQSAISQRVKQLEEQFGQILLLRTSPPMPTQAGKKVIKLYNQVSHIEDDFKASVFQDENQTFTPFPLGINVDSLDTWFFSAVRDFLAREKILLDLFVDDQENTHRFLRDGKVLACISNRSTAIQGCRIEYLGFLTYGLYCSPDFAEKWFPNGLDLQDLKKAPGICFTRDDELNAMLFKQIFDTTPKELPTHYVPSTTVFIDLVRHGTGYGMLPMQHSLELVKKKQIVDLAPKHKVKVDLYWHCWNLNSKILKAFTREVLDKFNPPA